MYLVNEDGSYLNHYRQEAVVIDPDGISFCIKENYEKSFWIIDET